jgi:type II secretion system protein H
MRGARLSGLSLIELMIVVVVLGIAAVLAAPMMAATDATRVDAAARMLMADLQFAQMYSITHADELAALRIQSGGAGYSVVTDGSPPFDCTAATAVTDIVNDTDYDVTFGSGRASELSGVSVDSYSLDGDKCVVFGAFGELDQTSAATITLSAGASTVTVSVDPISGEPTISP